MSKTKKVIVLVIILAGISAAGFSAYKQGWFGNTETSISTEPSDIELLNKKYKAYRDSVEAANKIKFEEMKKMQEKIDAANEEAAANQQPANQIATPVPANPADSTVVTIPVKKSGVGG